jgi:hypothetical protein
VAATNPTTAPVPTASHGYYCVHQHTFATSLAVADMPATVRWMAVLASAACCVSNTPSSVVLERPVFGGTVSHTGSAGGALLALTFVILVPLVLTHPVLPGT